MGEHVTWWSSHWLSLQGLLMICLASLLSEYLFQQSLQGLLIISFAFLSEYSFQRSHSIPRKNSKCCPVSLGMWNQKQLTGTNWCFAHSGIFPMRGDLVFEVKIFLQRHFLMKSKSTALLTLYYQFFEIDQTRKQIPYWSR